MDNNSNYLDNGLRLVVDWVGFTVTADMSVVQVIEFMGFSPMVFNDMPRGANGYMGDVAFCDIAFFDIFVYNMHVKT